MARRNHRAGAVESFGKGFWLTTMLLSMLIPILLRGTMAIAGALTLLMPVTAHRRHIKEDLEAWDHQNEKAQELALQRAGRYVANGRPGVWFFATLVLILDYRPCSRVSCRSFTPAALPIG